MQTARAVEAIPSADLAHSIRIKACGVLKLAFAEANLALGLPGRPVLTIAAYSATVVCDLMIESLFFPSESLPSASAFADVVPSSWEISRGLPTL